MFSLLGPATERHLPEQLFLLYEFAFYVSNAVRVRFKANIRCAL